MAEAQPSEEDCCRLLQDPEFNDAVKILADLEEAVLNRLRVHAAAYKNLEQCKEDTKLSREKGKKAIIGGLVGNVIGGVLMVTGIGLSFVTFGASLGLTIAGSVLSGLGSVTSVGASVGHKVVANQNKKHATLQVKTTSEITKDLLAETNRLEDSLAKALESLKSRHPNIPEERIWALLKDSAPRGNCRLVDTDDPHKVTSENTDAEIQGAIAATPDPEPNSLAESISSSRPHWRRALSLDTIQNVRTAEAQEIQLKELSSHRQAVKTQLLVSENDVPLKMIHGTSSNLGFAKLTTFCATECGHKNVT